MSFDAKKVYFILRPLIDELRSLVSGISSSAASPPGIEQGTQGIRPVAITNAGFALVVRADHPIKVAAGQKVTILTSVEYDATQEGNDIVEQQVVDSLANIYDDVKQSISGIGSEVLTRAFTFSPPAGEYTFSVQAKRNNPAAPTTSATNGNITITVQTALPPIL